MLVEFEVISKAVADALQKIRAETMAIYKLLASDILLQVPAVGPSQCPLKEQHGLIEAFGQPDAGKPGEVLLGRLQHVLCWHW
ncbi:MAG: hypothetical protein WAV13_09545, partial [Thermodesulfovibrionales bacterium]